MPHNQANAAGPAPPSTSSDLAESPEVLALVFEYAPDAKLLIDARGRIIKVNMQAESIFGYSRNDLVGKPIEYLIPDRFTGHHVADRTGYMSAPRLRPMGAGVDLYAKRQDGTEVPVDIMLGPIETGDGTLILAVVRDISDRKRIEEQLRASLLEKDILLHEIHHRVKNNLAVIGSSFYLQSTYVQDERTVRVLQNCQDRVRSMALVHERLYHSGNFASMDFAEYARELASGLVTNYSLQPDAIQITFDLDKVSLNLDQAVPCALILSEVIANALKHAFPAGRKGTISIRLSNIADGGFCLSASDDGIGLPDEATLAAHHSFGMRLVRSLVKQVGGRIEFVRLDPGTEVRLTLEGGHAKER